MTSEESVSSMEKVETKKISVEDYDYFFKLNTNINILKQKLGETELSKLEIIDLIKQAQAAIQTFQEQIYQKYDLDLNCNFSIKEDREIVIK